MGAVEVGKVAGPQDASCTSTCRETVRCGAVRCGAVRCGTPAILYPWTDGVCDCQVHYVHVYAVSSAKSATHMSPAQSFLIRKSLQKHGSQPSNLFDSSIRSFITAIHMRRRARYIQRIRWKGNECDKGETPIGAESRDCAVRCVLRGGRAEAGI
ncbi:hypothetical protein BU23DRAFT_895 [Bimuria novae-zelandiae CBS 107.79]|uniref:Uncharacterized protein n=1 Tax=Bimuria novae-zelandiae CBS 107.79 TaxID=1447943 RepID=A0A6A5VTZ1_9PLEO|nr:hypothetical protein BU23DRAFT_895 [Bimuria novae-zelandiae CBS 107.79]